MEQEESSTANSKSLKDFISTLPTREGWSQPLVLYKNYWFRPRLLEGILQASQDAAAFKPRDGDIVVATQPKCGTTWMRALVFTIVNRCRYSFTGDDHPLLTHNPGHLVPFIEAPDPGRHAYLETLASPRILSTHTPVSLLPPEMSSCGCRIVYVCRDPKDAFVSRWHFDNSLLAAAAAAAGSSSSPIDLHRAYDMFCEGFSPYGPFWDHCLEYWKESVARPSKVLFFKYEEIKADPVQVVRKLAEFLGVPLTQEEENHGVAQEVVRMCGFEMLTSLQVNQPGGDGGGGDPHRGNRARIFLDNSMFFRKRKVGEWANHLSQEMGKNWTSSSRRSLKDLASPSDLCSSNLLVVLQYLPCSVFEY